MVLGKEIHAYMNNDGTYRIEIKGYTMKQATSKTEKKEDTGEYKINVGRASVQIEILPEDGNGKLYSISV